MKIPNKQEESDDPIIQCKNCGKLFSILDAEVGYRILENTLTGLEDHNSPWIKCPHCEFVI